MPEAQRNATYRDAVARMPAGRIGKPADIADALLFVVPDGYMTGAVLDVDGGAHLG